MNHRWLYVSEMDPLDTEVCIDCGAQRDKNGPIKERAYMSSGWAAVPVSAEEHEEEL